MMMMSASTPQQQLAHMGGGGKREVEDLIFLTLLRLEVPWMSPVILIDDTCSGEAEEEEEEEGEDGQAGTTKPLAALDDGERDDASGTQLAEGKEKESPSPWKSLAIEDNRTDRATLAEKHTLASGGARPVLCISLLRLCRWSPSSAHLPVRAAAAAAAFVTVHIRRVDGLWDGCF